MSSTSPIASPPGAVGSPLSPPGELVLDASVAIKWYIPEVLAAEARALHVGAIPDARPIVLRGGVRQYDLEEGRPAPRVGSGSRSRDPRGVVAYPMQAHDTEGLVISAYDLAHGVGDPKLAVYDFVYLALAVALDLRLVTADRLFYDVIQPTPLAPRLLWVADPI